MRRILVEHGRIAGLAANTDLHACPHRGEIESADNYARLAIDLIYGLHESDETKAFLENVNSGRFVPMQDSDYDVIRKIAAAKAKAGQ